MDKEKERLEKISWALKENQAAVEFVLNLMFIARVWDDIIDRDKTITNDFINRMMWIALVEIPSNLFYSQYVHYLTPLIRDYINSWLDANNLEKGTEHDKHIAFVLRDMVGNIIIQCAYIIGGYDWMREVSPKIREIQFEEPLSKYMEGL